MKQGFLTRLRTLDWKEPVRPLRAGGPAGRPPTEGAPRGAVVQRPGPAWFWRWCSAWCG